MVQVASVLLLVAAWYGPVPPLSEACCCAVRLYGTLYVAYGVHTLSQLATATAIIITSMLASLDALAAMVIDEAV